MKKTSDILAITNIANNQVAIKTRKHWEFWSYGTLICIIDLNSQKHYLTDYWNYSFTTTKYLCRFLNKYSLEYGNDINKAGVRKLIKNKQIKMIGE